MSQETKKPLQELLNTQNSTEETNTNRENSFLYQKLDGTPFFIVGDTEKGYILTSGNFQLCEYMKSPEEVTDYFYEHPWEITITLITMVIHMNKQIQNFESDHLIGKKIQEKLEG